MILWPLTLLGIASALALAYWLCRCRHVAPRRAYVNGVLHFVCDQCGYQQPVLSRTKQDVRKAKGLAKQIQQQQKPPATVSDIRSRRRGA